MCGFIALPPRHPLASQALHHFRSTKRGISREAQVVQHTDHLIKNGIASGRLSANHTAFEYIYIFRFQYIYIFPYILISYLTSSIKVCCCEVIEDIRIAYSHISSYLSGQENCVTASSGERVCFTSTRRFEVFADQPSPRHDSTRPYGFL